jgi:signal transduction histidine kinase
MAALVSILAAGHLAMGWTGLVPSAWTWTAWPLLGAAVLSLAMGAVGNPRAGRFFVVCMGLGSWAIPWTVGGLTHPVLFLGLGWIGLATFLVAPRWGFLGAFAFLLDAVLLQVGRARGWVHDASAPIPLIAFDAGMLAVVVSSIVRTPLRTADENMGRAHADLAERQSLEEELVRSNTDLEERVESRRRSLLESRNVLRDGVEELSSLFREAIQGMRVDAEELALGADGDGEADWAIRRLALASHRMERIHESFLAFCRLGEQGISLQPITGRAHEALAMDAWSEVRQGHAGRDFTFVLEPLPSVEADPDLLRQVWLNLLSNAAKYTVSRSPAWIRVAHSGPWLMVEDNGVGFDPEMARDLFGLFQRLHSSAEYPGYGIGLATARRIVERHGGEIQAESLSGGGARFRFRFVPSGDSCVSSTDSFVAKEGAAR